MTKIEIHNILYLVWVFALDGTRCPVRRIEYPEEEILICEKAEY